MRRSSIVPAGLLPVMMLLLVAGASAQPEALKKSTPEERAKLQTAFLRERLSLTEEQLPKVSAINLKSAEKMQPVITGDQGPFKKRREMKEIGDEKDAEMKGVLTADQYTKYLAAKEEMQEKLKKRLMEKLSGQ